MTRPDIKTYQNLESAFAGESMAHIKYRYFARLARTAGDEDTARIFEQTADQEITRKVWQCIVCGFIYDESKGIPEDGIAVGTRFEDVPADWACPECGVAKADFEMVEVA